MEDLGKLTAAEQEFFDWLGGQLHPKAVDEPAPRTAGTLGDDRLYVLAASAVGTELAIRCQVARCGCAAGQQDAIHDSHGVSKRLSQISEAALDDRVGTALTTARMAIALDKLPIPTRATRSTVTQPLPMPQPASRCG